MAEPTPTFTIISATTIAIAEAFIIASTITAFTAALAAKQFTILSVAAPTSSAISFAIKLIVWASARIVIATWVVGCSLVVEGLVLVVAAF